MALEQESFVQVAPDSTGKKLRTFQALVQQLDGTYATVQIQAAEIVDEFGNPVSVTDQTPWQQRMLDETRAIRLGIQVIVEYLNPHSGVPTAPTVPGQNISSLASGWPGANEVNLLEWAQSIRTDPEEDA